MHLEITNLLTDLNNTINVHYDHIKKKKYHEDIAKHFLQ
jgi:hypothetical protein